MRSSNPPRLPWAKLLLPVEKQMLLAIALFTLLVRLAVWEFDTARATPLELFGAFAFGVILGVMTGVGLMVSKRWRG
jgi:ABC-type nitrate/sulfonate/bicarbonate transport system permease component